MTKEEIISEFWRLPPEEREAVVEEISRGGGANGSSAKSKLHADTIEEKLAALGRLRGVFKTAGPPPTDEELKEDYINYLTKKYS
jgi:hypothetical protein